jgi:hypothetical protein
METIETWEIPNEFIIRFHEGDEIKLQYIDETKGVCKYQASFRNPDCLLQGEKTILIVTIKHSLLTEKEKLFQSPK